MSPASLVNASEWSVLCEPVRETSSYATLQETLVRSVGTTPLKPAQGREARFGGGRNRRFSLMSNEAGVLGKRYGKERFV